jgi:hypothetical protein
MEVVHLDEDRIFSLNIAGKFLSTKEDRENELLMEITDDWLEKQIQTIIKHQNISIFVYHKELVKIHQWENLSSKRMGHCQLIEYRITLKVQTVITWR